MHPPRYAVKSFFLRREKIKINEKRKLFYNFELLATNGRIHGDEHESMKPWTIINHGLPG